MYCIPLGRPARHTKKQIHYKVIVEALKNLQKIQYGTSIKRGGGGEIICEEIQGSTKIKEKVKHTTPLTFTIIFCQRMTTRHYRRGGGRWEGEGCEVTSINKYRRSSIIPCLCERSELCWFTQFTYSCDSSYY